MDSLLWEEREGERLRTIFILQSLLNAWCVRLSELVSYKNKAYVLIEVEPGRETETIREIEKMERVEAVDFVHGEYDVVTVLKGNFKEVNEAVLAIRKLPHVKKTVTLNAFELPLI